MVSYAEAKEPILMIAGGFKILVLCWWIRGGDIMLYVCYYGVPISAMVLYFNTISAMKKVKNGEDTSVNTFVGCVLSGFIALSIMAMGISS